MLVIYQASVTTHHFSIPEIKAQVSRGTRLQTGWPSNHSSSLWSADEIFSSPKHTDQLWGPPIQLQLYSTTRLYGVQKHNIHSLQIGHLFQTLTGRNMPYDFINFHHSSREVHNWYACLQSPHYRLNSKTACVTGLRWNSLTQCKSNLPFILQQTSIRRG
jgi:hypothetical protein